MIKVCGKRLINKWSASHVAPVILLILLMSTTTAVAQSNDLSQPTPLRTDSVEGRIAPRDIGDPRTTQHYYVFSAQPGDLNITVTSDNLNGDVDLFVAGSFRPLLKIVFYSDASGQNSRTLFFRQGENLILRVDARSTDDREGSYQIRFGGVFAPSDLAVSEESATALQDASERTASTNRRGARRTTSVGGRIEEPERTETSPTLEMPPTPSEASETATTTPAEERPTAPPSVRPARTARATRTAREGRPSATPSVPRRSRARNRSTTARTRPRPAVTPAEQPRASDSETTPENSLARPETNARLIIETTDGESIVRSMRNVQRMTIENGEIIITTTEGETERVPLTRVTRVRIEQ